MSKIWSVLLPCAGACVAVGLCVSVARLKDGSGGAGGAREPRPTVGEQATTKAGYHACPTRDLLGEFLDARVRKDGAASLSAIRRGCELLSGGRAVVLEVPSFTSDTQIRVYGDVGHDDRVLWTTDDALVGH